MSGKAGPGGEQAAPAQDRPARNEPEREMVLMRALAHPARLALMSHLGHSGPATATECAGVVGLSPSAVSYHLRALAKAGLVEEAPGRGDGRERRWRRTEEPYQVDGPADPGPDELAALRGLLDSVRGWDEVRFRQYLAQLGDEPADWREAAFFMDSALLLTADELKAVGAALQELLRPYRKSARADAPAGARAVYAIFRGFPA
ncbi:MAG TPA: winged helix-turn-helix domain-containing protein [Streptosporangiaceae bacterium]|nr:winged helix-turn-helix domain-containing protein [Streptosporangiaceae bacterium]